MKLLDKYKKWERTWSVSQLVFLAIFTVFLISALAFVSYRFDQALVEATYWQLKYYETTVTTSFFENYYLTNHPYQ